MSGFLKPPWEQRNPGTIVFRNLKELHKPKNRGTLKQLALLYAPPKAQHILVWATHTHPVDFVIQKWKSYTLLWADWQIFSHLGLMCATTVGFCLSPIFNIFVREDSNKSLLNNRFHSLTREGPAWPKGVSCSFEHLNPREAADFPLLFTGGLFFRVSYLSGKAPVGCVQGAFSCKRSSLWDHQHPLNCTSLKRLCSRAPADHSVLMKNSSARDGETDLMSPSWGGDERKENICSAYVSAALCWWESTHRADIWSVKPWAHGGDFRSHQPPFCSKLWIIHRKNC